MAPSATSDSHPSSAAAMDGTGVPPSDVVQPPKEIRSIVEKTAGYVARNGNVFEDRIREKEVANPKFCFLNPNDAYHSFYVWRLEEIRGGRGTTVSAGPIGESAVPIQEKAKGPDPPPEFHFSARMPNINAQDLDVVRLTALWVAKNGRSFMTSLSQRESTNYQFDFLRPQHSLYQFFSRLVDQYSELLNARGTDGGKAEKARIEELTRNINDKLHLLDRSKQRAEWVKFQEQQKMQKEEEAEAEKLAYAQVDWHDFVVVETVLFNEADEEADLPPPTSLSDLQSASLEQKGMMSLASHNMRIEEAMPTDMDTPYYDPYQQQQQQHQQYQQPPPSQYAPQPPPSFPARPSFTPAPLPTQAPDRLAARDAATAATNLARANASNPTAPMNIRSDYVPRAQAQRAAAVTTLICPNCKQPVPESELAEHMRIELLDPRWKQQRAKADSQYATTNLSTADVANNLKRLASKRGDVFEPGVGGGEEGRDSKRQAVAYDGAGGVGGRHQGAAAQTRAMAGAGQPQAQVTSIEEQLRYIREKAGKQ